MRSILGLRVDKLGYFHDKCFPTLGFQFFGYGFALYLCTVAFYCSIVVVTDVCTSCSSFSLFLVPPFHGVVLPNCQSILKQRDREYKKNVVT